MNVAGFTSYSTHGAEFFLMFVEAITMRYVEGFQYGSNTDLDVPPQAARFSLSSEYAEQLAMVDPVSLSDLAGDAARAALRLFDGDRPLEVGGAPREKPTQEWVIAMNLASDFGNECTIEKRTKKLQELAADTRGKPITIVVQYPVKDKDGKFRLERFALSDGRVNRLESPGQSGGYAADVEQLLKFTNQNYQSRNLGLILDSHGSGNGGMMGDVGNLSLTELRGSVARGLKNSGHEQLDLLQFNACLMGQNGVLEATQKIARHIVASAEPEGTGAQGRDFDNRIFTQLLRNPSMTASELADLEVRQATDHADDFPTLAHFDMEKYGKFRESLDGFGEKIAKLCEDPAQLEVIRSIIAETFAYGGGSIKLLGLFHGLGGKEKPHAGDWGNLGSGSPIRSGSGRRDLTDFVARVLLAISKGQLKDTDGSIEKAAKSVLIDGTALVKSFFAAGEQRRNTGGLSAFLPTSATDDGYDDPVPSSTGGWRLFQQTLRRSLASPVPDNLKAS